ncbi:MAG: hypothetical protein CL916_02210 [Deltaproteobacteria bacterium]|nr:hypothetical protein [Deltaproteobacteria bacterium]
MSNKNLIHLRKSPLTKLYQSLEELIFCGGLAAEKSEFETNTISILNGRRTKRYPLIALTTHRSMGPARHVLSQRVVAGTFVVDAPYNPSQTHKNNHKSLEMTNA